MLAASASAVGGALLLAPSPALAVGQYANERIADIALSRVGQRGGQCKEFANVVVRDASGGSQWPAPGYHSGFQRAGGVTVTTANARKGDIIQVGNDENGRLHTAIVVSNQGGGSFWVVDSNWVSNETVGQHAFNLSWGNGRDTRIWRMGKVANTANPWSGVRDARFLGGGTVKANGRLRSNEYILSGDGRFVLIMQADGNLVQYSGGRALWASNTAGNRGAELSVQSDGNVVIYRGGTPIWSTGKKGIARLVMQSDGNLVGYRANDSAAWANNQARGTGGLVYANTHQLTAGRTLASKRYLRSADRRYVAVMQGDGNLVLHGPGYNVLWASNTPGNNGAQVTVQNDGNVVLYVPNRSPKWNTGKRSISRLVVQNDGNLVGYRSNGSAAWATNTAGRI
ncbi:MULTISPECIES: hypothetical protein [unclassified Nocardiopsis]|uniref:hypothetical protein n=1 Tax=Nocardiopsis TaxID=2013 RepID=UPI00387AC373